MTYEEIAKNWSLWIEYVDPNGEMSQEEFDSLSVEEKIDIQVAAFGPEKSKKIITHAEAIALIEQNADVPPTRILNAAGEAAVRKFVEENVSGVQDMTAWYVEAEDDAADAEEGDSIILEAGRFETVSGNPETLTLKPEHFDWVLAE